MVCDTVFVKKANDCRYKKHYQNTAAMFHKEGKSDLFITFTGDRNWPEIKVRSC